MLTEYEYFKEAFEEYASIKENSNTITIQALRKIFEIADEKYQKAFSTLQQAYDDLDHF